MKDESLAVENTGYPKLGQKFSDRPHLRLSRFLIMFPAGAMLIIGLIAGLARMGVFYLPHIALHQIHAPAMIFGFISSLIILERAVAISNGWALLTPPLFSVGAILLFFNKTFLVGQILILTGYSLLLFIYHVISKRQKAIATTVQRLGAFVGVFTLLAWIIALPIETVGVAALMFLVLTIIGERIELGRFAGLTRRGEIYGLVVSMLVALGAIAAVCFPEIGYRFLGGSLLVTVVWLFVVDVARRTVRAKGATRYMAVALLFGYVWLLVAAVIWIVFGAPVKEIFDLSMHAVGLGFVMSMIMAHASVILPAVLRVKLPYRKFFYVPLLLLQLSLAIRVFADLSHNFVLKQVGGAGNAIAIVLFLLTAVTSAIVAARSKD